jgi:hypothetical protein
MTNPIIRHKQTGTVYQRNDDGTYTNLISGNNGSITADMAKDFAIPVMANYLVQSNPLIIEMIKELKMTLER